MTLDEGHYYIYFFVAITYGKVSLFLWKSLENSGNFFSYFVATLPGVTAEKWKVIVVVVNVLMVGVACVNDAVSCWYRLNTDRWL